MLNMKFTMSNRNLLKSLAIFGAALLAVSCSIGESHNGPSRLQDKVSPTPAAGAQPSLSPTSTTNSPIRLVDFDNTAYPNFPDYSGSKKRRITLMPGKGGPWHINYGDITGDGAEEAMVVLGIESRGSAIPKYVYIFTMEKGRPKLIWDFETGDRADGGLRQIAAENGQLVIELFGKDRVIGGQLYRGEEGLCCPSSFTSARYRWTAKRFELISKETLSNPRGDANAIMPRYVPKTKAGDSL
jgi:hypothetical protein